MTSILVAGGAGLIGSHLTDRLLRRSDIARLLVVDNLWTGRLENLAPVSDPRYAFACADIEKFETQVLVVDEGRNLMR